MQFLFNLQSSLHHCQRFFCFSLTAINTFGLLYADVPLRIHSFYDNAFLKIYEKSLSHKLKH